MKTAPTLAQELYERAKINREWRRSVLTRGEVHEINTYVALLLERAARFVEQHSKGEE